MGNISEAKGIVFFLQVAARLLESAAQSTVRMVIAGPFESREMEKSVRARATALPNVEYVGPKYGVDKAQFFADVDVLLFPSIYHNEAEPLTILEAHSHGIPVISSDRGCIRGMISPNGGLLIPNMERFVETATNQLLEWIANPRQFHELSLKTRMEFDAQRIANEASAEKLYDYIAGNRCTF
jgi:glycosyltransferase involved in cell wall biosynthesis